MNRRRFLVTATATASVGLAGCTGSDDDGDDETDTEPPTAAFDWSPEDIRAGAEISFDATDSEAPETEIVAFRWTIGDQEATAETVSHTFDGVGEYEVTLEVEDENGNTDTTTMTVNVGEPEVVELLVEELLTLGEELDEVSSLDSLHNPDRLEQLQAHRDTAQGLLEDAEAAGASEAVLTATQEILAFQGDLVETHELDIEARTLYMDTTLDSAEILVEEGIDLAALDDNMAAFDQLEGILDDRVALQDSLESPNVDTGPLEEPELTYDGSPGEYTRYDSDDYEMIRTRLSDITGDLRAGTEMFHGIEQAEQGQWENARNRFSEALDIMSDAPDLPDETPAVVEDFLGPAFSDEVSSDDRDLVGILESMLDAAQAEDIDALDQEVEHLLEVTSFQR